MLLCVVRVIFLVCCVVGFLVLPKKEAACLWNSVHFVEYFCNNGKVIVDVADFTHVQTLTKISICYNIKQEFWTRAEYQHVVCEEPEGIKSHAKLNQNNINFGEYLLLLCVLSKNGTNTRTFIPIYFTVLYPCETRSLALKEEYRHSRICQLKWKRARRGKKS